MMQDMANSLSSDESSSSDIEINSGYFHSITADLSLDDFNDEDLSEITEEKTLRHSFVNGRYKKEKVRLSARQISEHMKKISPDMIQLDLTGGSKMESTTIAENVERSASHHSRPQTLSLFSEAKSEMRSLHGKHEIDNKGSLKSRDTRTLAARRVEKMSETVKNSSKERRNHKTLQQSEGTSAHTMHTTDHYLTRSASEWSIEDPESVEYCYLNGEIKRQSHVAAFKFVPRHSDELELEIYDPIHVEMQAEDLWYEGLNMRTGERGVFPSYYAQNVHAYAEDLPESEEEAWNNFSLYFIGSVEVPCHKGNDVLCQAMYKVAEARRETLHSSPPAYVCLKISTRGVKMIDQSELKHYKSSKGSRVNRCRIFSSSSKVKQQTHFFQLKNVSFCGHHPRNEKYLGFITRHPSEYRFACHTFVCESSTRPIIDCFGTAFAQYFQEYVDYVQPSDDIYLE